MSDKTTELSTTDIINKLYETVWAISDSIGINLEVAEGRIPQQNIDPPALAKRMLVDGMAQVSKNLELLNKLENSIEIKAVDMKFHA